MIFVLCYKFLSIATLWKNDADRTRWIAALNHDSWKTFYHDTMFDVLEWLNNRLSRPEISADAPPARVAFSHGLINATMVLAVAYPLLSFIAQWLAGSPLQIGDLSIAPAGSGIARIFVIFWLSASFFLYLYAAKTKSRWRWPSFIRASVILYGGIFVSKQFDVPAAIAVAVAVAIAIAGASAIAGAGAGAGAGALQFAEQKYGKRPVFSLLYLAALFLLITLAIYFLPSLETTKTFPPTYLLLFFAIFPILNAVADFASTGLTRYLLHRGLARSTPLNALMDTIGGVVIFFILGGAIITYIHLVRPIDGTPLLDLGELFNQLQTNRSDYWWLALMLGSTLLPTFLHLLIGIATLALQYPEVLRQWIVKKLESGAKGSEIHGRLGSIAICVLITLAIWLPLYGFNWLFTLNHGALIDGVIFAFYSYADLIGAL